MKKRILALICIFALLISSLSGLANASETQQAEKTYISGEVKVKVNRYIDPSLYSLENPNIFCGISAYSVKLLTDNQTEENIANELEEKGYLEYIVRFVSDGSPFKIINYLKKRSDVVNADLNYVPYDYDEKAHLLSTDGEIEYMAFAVLLDLKTYSEPFGYQDLPVDLHGVPVRELQMYLFDTQEEADAFYNEYGYYLYLAIIDPSVSVAEAIEIWEKNGSVESAAKNAIAYSDEEQGSINAGDINDNGVIDMTDYILVKRAYFGTYTLSGLEPARADINCNDIIDMTDYILIKRMYFGTWSPGQTVEPTPDEAN